MRIEPYKSVGELDFGASEARALASLGKPQSQRKNKRNESELVYENVIYRFDDGRGLLECSGYWATIELNKTTIPVLHLASFLKQNDSEATEQVGFVVSKRFGIAVDTEHEGWVTVFEKGRWDGI